MRTEGQPDEDPNRDFQFRELAAFGDKFAQLAGTHAMLCCMALSFQGSDLSVRVCAGVFVFTWAYVIFIPSWLNEKKPGVSINKSIWTAGAMSAVGYLLVGVMCASTLLSVPDIPDPGPDPPPPSPSLHLLSVSLPHVHAPFSTQSSFNAPSVLPDLTNTDPFAKADLLVPSLLSPANSPASFPSNTNSASESESDSESDSGSDSMSDPYGYIDKADNINMLIRLSKWPTPAFTMVCAWLYALCAVGPGMRSFHLLICTATLVGTAWQALRFVR
jgi:hypothetical protein